MPIILIIGGVIIAGLVGVLVFFSPNNENEAVVPADSNNEMNIRVEDIEDMNDTKPTDGEGPTPSSDTNGTFEASSTYLTPARTEHLVNISLTIEGGVVTNSRVLFDDKAEGESSNDNQARFADAYKSEVIGKSLSEISLSRVGGASLTSQAFNEAVAKIAVEATTESAL